MFEDLLVQGISIFGKRTHFAFSSGLNIIIGGNDSGKSHVLKLCYTAVKWTRRFCKETPHTPELQLGLARDLGRIFAVQDITSLISHHQAPAQAQLEMRLGPHQSYCLEWSPQPANSICIKEAPAEPQLFQAIMISPREVLSLYPSYMQVGRSYPELMDGANWELCRALEQAALAPQDIPPRLQAPLQAIQEIIGGQFERRGNRFYLKRENQEAIELSLIAEGFKRLGTLALLIENGSIHPESTLLWDEPEMNLNISLLPHLVKLLLQLSEAGVQIILSTHSLFLLRELSIQMSLSPQKDIPRRFFTIQKEAKSHTSQVHSAENLDDLEPLESLQAEIEQADRYLMMGLEEIEATEDIPL